MAPPRQPNVNRRALIAFSPPGYLRSYHEWIQFPKELSLIQIIINRLLMPIKWTFWTNRALLACDSQDIRARLGNQYAVLGSTAGILITISASWFFSPPIPETEDDAYFIAISGVFMFASTMLFISYVIVSLTVLFPLVESARDELASYMLHEMCRNLNNIDGFIFTLGVNCFALGVVSIVPVIYSMKIFYVILLMLALTYL